MKFIHFSWIAIVVLCTSTFNYAQKEIELVGEKKAFIYHVIWKNKRLDDHLGKYFEYIGEPYLKRDGKTPKRDSVEWAIKNNGEKLLIRSTELGKVSKGMLQELCNKLALHDLNLMVKHRNSEEPQHEYLLEEYKEFVDLYATKLPPYAMKSEGGEDKPLLKMEKILAPTYSTKSKINVAASGGAFDVNETKAIVVAINETINNWVANRARQYFEAFGGRMNYFDNQLMSAGDGGGFSGASKEQKEDEWFRGLTPDIGFFYYVPEVHTDDKGKRKVQAMHVPVVDYKTYGHDTITNIHFDIWGKSKERQTTVVIQKGINSYILYDKDESDLLSPDSNYNKDGVTTYQMLIDELKNVHIAYYEEMIYGKRGYDYQIEYHTKQKDICLEKIKVTEYKLNKIRYSTGSGNVVNYKPKEKNHQPGSNESVKKQKRTTQDELMYWYKQLEYHKEMIVKLKKEKEIALEILATLKDKLSNMEKNIGYRVLTYEEKDGLYIFEDSSTFNYETQDFKFMGTKHPEEYNIRVLSFDDKVLSTKADEVQIHWSICEEDIDESLALNKKFVDAFGINSYTGKFPILKEEDSVKIKELVQFIIKNPKAVQFDLSGNGKGKILENGKYEKDNVPEYFKEYPNGDSISFQSQNATTLKIAMDKKLNIQLATYTDGREVFFKSLQKDVQKLLEPGSGVHRNEVISAARTQSVLMNFLSNFNSLASKFADAEEAAKAFSILDKAAKKAKINIGRVKIKAWDKSLVGKY
ncbi:MAG: hypothetical protein KDC84_09445 [Crocinitomicaceae bacterium]|nr:hypothetical protein [Crocinitomicaceae bacterium]